MTNEPAIPFHLETHQFGASTIQLQIPDDGYIQQKYKTEKLNDKATPFPYWARIWPSSIALCEFIAGNPVYIQNKNVLELAAGLGLPSLLSAPFAANVIASDYLPEAVGFIRQSAAVNNFQNIECRLIDWNAIDESITADVLLLSDINYAPAAFEQLFKVVYSFIMKGSTILLSTPQRLSAKSFLEKLLHWRINEKEMVIQCNNEAIYTTVWVLKKH